MKSIFIDCSLGISGDMLASALLDLGVPKSVFLDNLVSLNIDKNYNFNFKEADSEGIKGIVCTKTEIQFKELSRSLNDIKNLLLDSSLNDYVKKKSIRVFEILAEAEAAARIAEAEAAEKAAEEAAQAAEQASQDRIEAAAVNEKIEITMDFTNDSNVQQSFALIVQIKDSNNTTISLSHVTGMLGAGQTLDQVLSYTPTEAGTYTVEKFLWNNFADPTALTDSKETFSLTVS